MTQQGSNHSSSSHHYCDKEGRITKVETVAVQIKEGQDDLKKTMRAVVDAVHRLEEHIAAMGFGEYKQWVRDTHKETSRRLSDVEDVSAQTAQDLRWIKKAMAGIWAAVVMLGGAVGGAIWHLVQQIKH